jgi:urease accessory protein
MRLLSRGVLAALALCAGNVHAHAIDPRIGDFYTGLLHPLTALEHLLPILALGLLTAQHGLRRAQSVLLVFPLALAAGALLALAGPPLPFMATLNLGWAVLIGVLAAMAVRLPLAALGTLAAGCALTHGYVLGGEMPAQGNATLFVLGLACGAFIGLAYVVAGGDFALRQKPRWLPVAIRAGSSWIAAIGILVLGLSLRLAPAA